MLTSTNILEDVGSQIPENLFKGKVLWIFSGCLVDALWEDGRDQRNSTKPDRPIELVMGELSELSDDYGRVNKIEGLF